MRFNAPFLRSVHAASCCLGLLFVVGAWGQEPGRPRLPRQLPGAKKGGEVLLPNQWTIKPTGFQTPLGVFPVQIAVHPSGKWLAVLHAGADEHEVAVVAVASRSVVSRVKIPQAFYGVAFSNKGDAVYVSGGEFSCVHRFQFADGYLSQMQRFQTPEPKKTTVVSGVACSADDALLYVSSPWNDLVFVLDGQKGGSKGQVKFADSSYPYTVLPTVDRLFVSLWGANGVAVVDAKTLAIQAVWPTESHPTEMALTPDGKRLFVSCANSTKACVLDAKLGTRTETLDCGLYPKAPSGSTPSSLCLSADGALLFVANADANNVAVFNVAEAGEAKALGFIPVGWYPTSVRYLDSQKKLFVANGKGGGSKANPQGPNPEARTDATIEQYIARLFPGSLSTIELPAPDKMEELTVAARKCSPLKLDAEPTGVRPEGNPIPAKVGDRGPIKHCIYIVKENRTYDQVLGDMPEGNGDPHLCIFPESVTPNHHKIAREFVLLDNFYVDGEVSADGHEWTMGAYATDYVEKVWPLKYRRGGPKTAKLPYPAEGANNVMATPAGGYFWDRCKEAGVTFRSYGEFINNGETPNDPGVARVKTLEGFFDPQFRSYDLSYSDQKRADRFIVELGRFEKEGVMPQFIVIRLPNDHTSGTAPNRPTPRAMVADNDLALGRIVEAVSKSKFWNETAMFVIEDDAQNGPDHVDAHRSVAFVVSPYCRRKAVDSAMYSTSSMLRTMGLILGTKPLSQFDAAAQPMYGCFQAKLDSTPYLHAPARIDLKELNKRDAWGAEKSAAFRLEKEDQADDIAFNEVIWRSVKGANSPMPAPVRAGFFRAKPEAE